jgi:predicted alpha/beta-hydrolase family hydrolase
VEQSGSRIEFGPNGLELLLNGPERGGLQVVLAHGAGQPMDAPFMETMATGLAAEGFGVVRFEFPYMAARRATGRKRPPDRVPVLSDVWRTVIRHLAPANLLIGGKSMGGRIASMVADEMAVDGLVCLGYPFHPPGRPEKRRVEHLAELQTPCLICQGDRDPFGKPEEVKSYQLSPSIDVHWIADGDHGFKPRKKSGRTEAQNVAQAILAVSTFARSLCLR